MTRIASVHAELGDTADFDVIVGGVVASNTQTLNSDYSFQIGGSDSALKNLPDKYSEFYFRICVRPGDLPDDNEFQIRFFDSATAALTFTLRANGDMYAYRGSTSGTFLKESDIQVFYPDTWCRIEIYALIANVGGALEVRVDGVTALTFSGDTLAGTVVGADNFQIATGVLGVTETFYFAHIAMNDTDGLTNTTWPGEGYYWAGRPRANGATNDYTPSPAVDNYLNVDETPPDDDTSYNEASTPGDVDLYYCEAFSFDDRAITLVFPESRARSTVGGDNMRLIVRPGVSNNEGVDIPLTTAYLAQQGSVYNSNPDTANDWENGQIVTTQMGVEHQ